MNELNRILGLAGIPSLNKVQEEEEEFNQEEQPENNDENEYEDDVEDTITMDVPLFIRVMEYAREDIGDDTALHSVVDKIVQLSNNGTLTMDDFNEIAILGSELGDYHEEPVEEEEVNRVPLRRRDRH